MTPPLPRRRRTVFVRPDELDDPDFRPMGDHSTRTGTVAPVHDHAPPSPGEGTRRTDPRHTATIIASEESVTPKRHDRALGSSDAHEVEATTDARFAAFYRDTWDQVARGLTATLGDRALAVEAADEAMARAYAHWAKIGGYDFPAGWVYRVGLNWARSYHRRMARALPLRRNEHAQLDGGTVDGIADPAIRDALVDLDVKHRSVVVCRLLLDWSVDDTAVALDIAPGTVKSRLSRALTVLESTLGHLR